MVGEIRDSETAVTAFQAAQTGHLVLSTLHTNDAPSAVIRLMDLGIDPFLVSASLIAIIGQRLVRGICQECKIPDSVHPEQMELILPYIGHEKDAIFWKGAGCEACQFTGYSGRLGLFEVFTMTPTLRRIISPDLSAIMLKDAAEKEGFLVMAIDGITKAMQGLTTIDEVFRVAPPEARGSTGGPVYEPPGQEEEGLPEEHSVPASKASLISVTPKKILVVDDNAIILKLLRHLLEAEDYLVVTAENGLEGLKMTSTERPNLIITDFLMPKMDGVTFIRKLKSQMSTRFIPIIVLTAKDEVESEVEVIDAGADDYLTKPVVAKRLLVRVGRLLSS
jgi:type IV pilus assembly protein PilB